MLLDFNAEVLPKAGTRLKNLWMRTAKPLRDMVGPADQMTELTRHFRFSIGGPVSVRQSRNAQSNRSPDAGARSHCLENGSDPTCFNCGTPG